MREILSIVLVVSLSLILGCSRERERAEAKELEGTITMSGAWALYPVVVRWAEEFQKIHPGVRLDVGAGGAGKGMADCLARVVDIGMVSREIYPEEIKKGAWWVSVAKDAVVPTVNESNPILQDLLTKGITRDVCYGIWISGDIENWGDAIGQSVPYAIHVYTRSDACGAAKTWAKYLGGNQEDLLGVGVYGDPGLAEAVKNDPLGIGFNNINYAYDTRTKRQVKGIRVLPIDLDGDRLITEYEDFYQTRDEIVQAIMAQIYPSPPARDLHFVCQGRPQRKVVREFIRWVLMEGQKYVPESGYVNLAKERLQEGLEKLEGESE